MPTLIFRSVGVITGTKLFPFKMKILIFEAVKFCKILLWLNADISIFQESIMLPSKQTSNICLRSIRSICVHVALGIQWSMGEILTHGNYKYSQTGTQITNPNPKDHLIYTCCAVYVGHTLGLPVWCSVACIPADLCVFLFSL